MEVEPAHLQDTIKELNKADADENGMGRMHAFLQHKDLDPDKLSMNLEQSANAQIGGSAKDLSSIHTACAACNVLNLEEWSADAVKDDATDGAADDVADDLETLSLVILEAKGNSS